MTAGMGSVIAEGGRAERRVRFACLICLEERWGCVSPLAPWLDDDGNTIPGESSNFSLLSSFTSRKAVVTPASAPTGHAVEDERERREVRALMTEDLPTLG